VRGLQTEQHCFHILHAHSYFWELLKKDVLHTDDITETYDLVNGFFRKKAIQIAARARPQSDSHFTLVKRSRLDLLKL